jgi:nitroreductase
MNANHFPHGGDNSQKLTFLLWYAILAPSSHNTQPWQFAVHENELDLHADRTRWL